MGKEMNFEVHVLPGERYEPRIEGIDPRIIYYHRGVTARKEIASSAYPLISARIDLFNERVREERPIANEGTERGLVDSVKARAFEALGRPGVRPGICLAGHRDYLGRTWLEFSRLFIAFLARLGL